MRRPTQLRNIHSRSVGESRMPLLHLSGDPDEHSSSEHSCDTVIYVAPDGSALSDRELTDNEGPPESVPIVPDKEQISPTHPVPPIPLYPPSLPTVPEEGVRASDCLKCNTFAELQERLDCIDGSEAVITFPHEEVLTDRSTKIQSQSINESQKRISNDQQLEEIREVVEEAEIAQSIIESLAKSSMSNLTGVGQFSSLQRTKSSSVHTSRESISGGNISDSKPRLMGSPRLGIASLTKSAEYRAPSSPAQRCKVYTQKGVMPSTHTHSSQNLHQYLGRSSTESPLQPEPRTSSVYLSTQLLKQSSTSNSLDSSLDSQSEFTLEQTSQQTMEQIPQQTPHQTLNQIPHQMLEQIQQQTLKQTPQQTLQQMLEQTPQQTLEQIPQQTLKQTSHQTLEQIPQQTPQQTLEQTLHQTLKQIPQQTLEQDISESLVLVLDSGSGLMSEDLVCTSTISEINIAKLKREAGPRSSVKTWLSEISTGSDGSPSCQAGVAQQGFREGDEPAEIQLLEKKGDDDAHRATFSNVQTVSTFNCRSSIMSVKPILTNTRSPMSISSKIYFDDPWMKKDNNNVSSPENTKSKDVFENPTSGGSSDCLKRVVDGCEMVINPPEIFSFGCDQLRTGSLPRGWHRLSRQDDLEEFGSRGVTTSTPCSPGATLERGDLSGRTGFFTHQRGLPPLPPVRKSSLDQGNRAFLGSTPEELGKQKALCSESGRLFSTKLEHLASRTNSLGRSHGTHYDSCSVERAESLTSVGSRASPGKDSTMSRLGRSVARTSNLSAKSSPSKISAVTKLLMASPRSRNLSTPSTRTLSFSTRSLPKSESRSSSLPLNTKQLDPNSWSTQSLSRSRGALPIRAIHGRISELLQGGAGGGSTQDKGGVLGHTLPSPYSKITAPRQPHRGSHASDNSSILSGELPPAMGKTALFYHSGGSSGYESMIRDSETTTSSAQESMSDNSSSLSSRRSLKISKKRNNTPNNGTVYSTFHSEFY